MCETHGARFLTRVSLIPERVPAYDEFPYGIPFVRGLDLTFTKSVTYLVGENGTGKSTLVEAIAEACGFPVAGGSGHAPPGSFVRARCDSSRIA